MYKASAFGLWVWEVGRVGFTRKPTFSSTTVSYFAELKQIGYLGLNIVNLLACKERANIGTAIRHS